MASPVDDGSGDRYTAEHGPIVQSLSEDNPLAAFASEQNDEVEQGTVTGPISRSVVVPDIYTSALPIAADVLRSDADEPLRLKLAPARRRGYRLATRMSAAAAAIVLAAVGTYLYRPQPAPRSEQVAAARTAERQLSAAPDANPAVVTSTHTDVTVARSTIEAPPRRITRRAVPSLGPISPVGPAEAPPVSGEWMMNTRVESSRLERYEGLRLGYRVTLRQDGNRISGTGWKVSEDEQTIGATARTPITFDGTLNDDRLELTFTEQGRLRVTVGKLVLARHSENAMRGRFSTTAAQSVGVAEIYR